MTTSDGAPPLRILDMVTTALSGVIGSWPPGTYDIVRLATSAITDERAELLCTTCLQIAVVGRQKDVELGGSLAASDRDVPQMTRVNGTLMGQRPL